MTSYYDIKDLPHIVALRARVATTRAAITPDRYPRRAPLCPEAADAYDAALREYFAAVDAACASLDEIQESIVRAYAPADAVAAADTETTQR